MDSYEIIANQQGQVYCNHLLSVINNGATSGLFFQSFFLLHAQILLVWVSLSYFLYAIFRSIPADIRCHTKNIRMNGYHRLGYSLAQYRLLVIPAAEQSPNRLYSSICLFSSLIASFSSLFEDAVFFDYNVFFRYFLSKLSFQSFFTFNSNKSSLFSTVTWFKKCTK